MRTQRTNKSPMKKQVIAVLFVPAYRGARTGSNMLALECGHTTGRKTSVHVPKNATCRECAVKPRATPPLTPPVRSYVATGAWDVDTRTASRSTATGIGRFFKIAEEG